MDSRCAWCGTFLPRSSQSHARVSHAICIACFDELERALHRSGLRTAEGARSSLANARPP